MQQPRATFCCGRWRRCRCDSRRRGLTVALLTVALLAVALLAVVARLAAVARLRDAATGAAAAVAAIRLPSVPQLLLRLGRTTLAILGGKQPREIPESVRLSVEERVDQPSGNVTADVELHAEAHRRAGRAANHLLDHVALRAHSASADGNLREIDREPGEDNPGAALRGGPPLDVQHLPRSEGPRIRIDLEPDLGVEIQLPHHPPLRAALVLRLVSLVVLHGDVSQRHGEHLWARAHHDPLRLERRDATLDQLRFRPPPHSRRVLLRSGDVGVLRPVLAGVRRGLGMRPVGRLHDRAPVRHAGN